MRGGTPVVGPWRVGKTHVERNDSVVGGPARPAAELVHIVLAGSGGGQLACARGVKPERPPIGGFDTDARVAGGRVCSQRRTGGGVGIVGHPGESKGGRSFRCTYRRR